MGNPLTAQAYAMLQGLESTGRLQTGLVWPQRHFIANQDLTALNMSQIGLNQPHTCLNQPHTCLNQPHTCINQPHTSKNQHPTCLNQPQISINQPHTSLNQSHKGLIQVRVGLNQSQIGCHRNQINISFPNSSLQEPPATVYKPQWQNDCNPFVKSGFLPPHPGLGLSDPPPCGPQLLVSTLSSLPHHYPSPAPALPSACRALPQSVLPSYNQSLPQAGLRLPIICSSLPSGSQTLPTGDLNPQDLAFPFSTFYPTIKENELIFNPTSIIPQDLNKIFTLVQNKPFLNPSMPLAQNKPFLNPSLPLAGANRVPRPITGRHKLVLCSTDIEATQMVSEQTNLGDASMVSMVGKSSEASHEPALASESSHICDKGMWGPGTDSTQVKGLFGPASPVLALAIEKQIRDRLRTLQENDAIHAEKCKLEDMFGVDEPPLTSAITSNFTSAFISNSASTSALTMNFASTSALSSTLSTVLPYTSTSNKPETAVNSRTSFKTLIIGQSRDGNLSASMVRK